MLSFIEINHINLYKHFMKSLKQPLYYAILKHLSGPLTTIYTPRTTIVYLKKNHIAIFIQTVFCQLS